MILQAKQPLQRKSLADGVYEALLENILHGGLKAGTEINEVALAQELQVSRTPVHEAVGRLLKDGLLVQEPPRRILVARFSRQDAVEIYEMRRLLESAAAQKAVRRMSDVALRALQDAAESLERMRGAPDWTARALEFDLRFHDALAEAAGNRRLRADISRYRLLVRAFCRMTATPANLEEAFQEHRTILAAIEARDAAAAARAAGAHVEKRCAVVLSTLFPEVAP